MFIIGNLLMALATVVHYVLNIYMWLVLARAVLSWVNPDPYNPIVRFLYATTEPVLYRIRRTLPLPMVGLDLSPIVVFLVIIFLDNFLVPTMQQLAMRLQ
ncbi:MAG: YggT family protein [Desulfobacterota bacterium]|nr:YggT family protein [Thermodesulfobacteriota bacterium]